MQNQKTLVLLHNLGTPSGPDVASVRRYLDEFLMDKEVIAAPFLVRWLLVKAIILPRRPKKSAAAYQSIWTSEGSPLLVYSQRQQRKLQQLLPDITVDLCMRYGEPSIENSVKKLVAEGFERVLFFPLYPQYATATTRSSIHKLQEMLDKYQFRGELKIIQDFYADQGFIDSLADNIEKNMQEQRSEHLLLSYHGVPESMIRKNDPSKKCLQANCCDNFLSYHPSCYRAQCFATSKALVGRLQLQAKQYSISFQSRLGPTRWLQPYTDESLRRLAGQGVKRLSIASPAFTADCLETLEELAEEGAHIFKEAGGEHLSLVPAVNDKDSFIQYLADKALVTLNSR